MLDDAALDLLFRKARTYRQFQPRAVGDDQLRAIFELARLGPTSANCQPARFVFLRSADAKARLIPFLDKGNVRKVEAAAVTVIVAYDLHFHELLDRIYPEDPRAPPRSRRRRSATGRCKAPISSSRRAPSASTPGRCRGSGTRASTRSSSPTGAGARTS